MSLSFGKVAADVRKRIDTIKDPKTRELVARLCALNEAHTAGCLTFRVKSVKLPGNREIGVGVNRAISSVVMHFNNNGQKREVLLSPEAAMVTNNLLSMLVADENFRETFQRSINDLDAEGEWINLKAPAPGDM